MAQIISRHRNVCDGGNGRQIVPSKFLRPQYTWFPMAINWPLLATIEYNVNWTLRTLIRNGATIESQLIVYRIQ